MKPHTQTNHGNAGTPKTSELQANEPTVCNDIVIEKPIKLANTPMHAACGDDDRMSNPQPNRPLPNPGDTKMHLPSKEELIGKWKKNMGAAKVQWAKLTDNELLESEGHVEKLAGLVQERYAIASDEAARQVKAFFAERDPSE